MAGGHEALTYVRRMHVTTTDWPLVLIISVTTAVLLGVVGGYLSARLAVIGSERRLNRALATSTSVAPAELAADV